MAVIEREMTIAEAADRVSSWLPGHRVEILRGSIIVTPPPDEPHQGAVFEIGCEIRQAGAKKAGIKVRPGIGLWLPTGPADYAIPDLSVVEADIADALVQKNCYAPHVFRMVLEVTSSNWADDTANKVEIYAEAGIPVYLVADRRHDEVLLYTEPSDGKYPAPLRYKRGESVPLPESVGVTLDLSVDTLLDGDD
ncbi:MULTISPECIES: Uma2 family endonuclease [unclassified Streptomyces]|uniref:Uma2 family endonuclease n=1 Tax=unclassified Streptomyces TaxID=2593676 RepID=UPI002365963E|nr:MULTISPECIES: Uma2 family endonuclease [unclassified Streptomyces]MDF3144396.1 Uma2 family endonuclease [Streptomyces sp. T21Q-yed]WDF40770.1 Uma2 family endonuclease [Streptomyces sp. T12]